MRKAGRQPHGGDHRRSTATSAGPTQRPIAAATTEIGRLAEKALNGPHDAVQSKDGAATLYIPHGSLPAGTQLSDIHVEPQRPGESGVQINDGTPHTVYKLSPDGVQFTAPILLRVAMPLPTDGSFPTFYSLSGRSIERFGEVAVALDETSGTMTADIPVRHFSLVFSDMVNPITMSDAGERVAGETFKVDLKFQHKNDVKRIAFKSEGKQEDFYVIQHLESVSLTGRLENTGSAVMRPKGVQDFPPQTRVEGGGFTGALSLSCARPGNMALSYDGWIDEPYTLEDNRTHEGTVRVRIYPSRRPCGDSITPIVASFSQDTFSTEYAAGLINPSAHKVSAKWSSPNCGSAGLIEEVTSRPSKRLAFTWSHPHPPCDKTTEHKEVTIQMEAAFPATVARCTYPGASDGTGPECAYTPVD